MTTCLPPLPSVRDLIRLYRLRAKKQLSQNFLLDLNLTKKIVRRAGNLKDSYVCEVGPGPGAITRGILEAGVKQLTVVEKDDRFIPGLQMLNEASGRRMRIFNADILTYDTSRLFPKDTCSHWTDESPPLHIIGNLPFNVSTPLLIHWLRCIADQSQAWSQGRVPMTLTFQKEVADRIVAPITSKHRCRLSVICQSLCDVKFEFTIPGKAFVPAPKVDVGVVTLVPKVTPSIDFKNCTFTLVEKLIRNVFHMRQKKCKHGLKNLFPVDTDLHLELLSLADVNGDTRSYALHVNEFTRLVQAYSMMCSRYPHIQLYDFRASKQTYHHHEPPHPTNNNQVGH